MKAIWSRRSSEPAKRCPRQPNAPAVVKRLRTKDHGPRTDQAPRPKDQPLWYRSAVSVPLNPCDSGMYADRMDLRQLEIIRAIADSGSFTAAGEKLHVSQSAISRQILLLEDELGEPVFHRIGRRIRITP